MTDALHPPDLDALLASRGLHAEGRETGISAPLSRNVNLVGGLLGEVVAERHGQPMLELIERLRLLVARGRAGGRLIPRARRRRASSASGPGYTARRPARFHDLLPHLVNKAEQLEVARIKRREQTATADHPAPSHRGAVHNLVAKGLGAAEVRGFLGRLDIQSSRRTPRRRGAVRSCSAKPTSPRRWSG